MNYKNILKLGHLKLARTYCGMAEQARIMVDLKAYKRFSNCAKTQLSMYKNFIDIDKTITLKKVV